MDLAPRDKARADPARCDVAVVGAGIAGAATALLLRRRLPGARVLLIEEQERFTPGSAESAVGPGALLLARALRLDELLGREHVPRHGDRYWFADSPASRLADMSEVGSRGASGLPSFHIDRTRLAEFLVTEAEEQGVRVLRPARVLHASLGWPAGRLRVRSGSGERDVETRWIVDASGHSAHVARDRGLLEKIEGERTVYHEARWSRVLGLDSIEVLGRDPRDPELRAWGGSRSLAENHFCGRGWVVSLAPLRGGETAVRLVHDPKLTQLPGAATSLEAYSRFVRTRPGLRELLSGARIDANSLQTRVTRSFRVRRACAPGWFLVGDAAGVAAPLFGGTLDRTATTVWNAVSWIVEDLRGAVNDDELERALVRVDRGIRLLACRALQSRGRDVLELHGDVTSLAAAFFLDSALAETGTSPSAARSLDTLLVGSKAHEKAFIPRTCLRERLILLACRRQASGRYGLGNDGWTCPSPRRGTNALFLGLALWARLEFDDFRERFTPIADDTRESETAVIRRYSNGKQRSLVGPPVG